MMAYWGYVASINLGNTGEAGKENQQKMRKKTKHRMVKPEQNKK
jgi:hypothetical protein